MSRDTQSGESITLYRVQDSDGRGPYKPGISHIWSDQDSTAGAPYFEEFGWQILDTIPQGMHSGCAFQTMDQLHAWFSQAELNRLLRMGYQIVTVKADGIAAQSDRQTVFWCRRPLKFATPFLDGQP